MTGKKHTGGKRLIQSIERATAILEFIAGEGGAAYLRDIAASTGLGKTTAHNILTTLDELGYVARRVNDTRYHLGGRILNLARVAGDDSALRIRLRPVIEALAARTGETAYLGVPSGDEVLYLDVVESFEAPRAVSLARSREPLEGSAIGLVFLAFMPGLRKRVLSARTGALGPDIEAEIEKVAARGYSLDVETYVVGLNCVAVPWRENGEVRASIGLSGPAHRLEPGRMHELAWMMLSEAQRVK